LHFVLFGCFRLCRKHFDYQEFEAQYNHFLNLNS